MTILNRKGGDCLRCALLVSVALAMAGPLALTPAASAPEGSLSGVIRGHARNPLIDVWVTPSGVDRGEWYGDTQTDSTASYTVAKPPSGDYRVEAFTQGRVKKWNDNTFWHHEAQRARANAPTNAPNTDFAVEIAGTISGRITDSQDNPLANVSVDCERIDGPGGGGAVSGADGSYTIDGLPLGQYIVNSPSWSRREGNDVDYILEYYDNRASRDSADIVTLSSDNADLGGIDFALEIGGRISGAVVDSQENPIAGITVAAINRQPWQVQAITTTDANGDYVLTGLPTGSYLIIACSTCSGLSYIDEYYDDTYSYEEATPVPVVAPNTTSGIDFVLELGGEISGSVVDSQGDPIAEVYVYASGGPTVMGAGANTDTNGVYVLRGLATGVYLVQACSSCSGLPYIDEYYDDTYSYEEATPVDVVAPNTRSGIDFVLEIGGSISGVVYNEDGSMPLAGVQVWAADCVGGSSAGSSAVTGGDGRYTLMGLPNSTFSVTTEYDFCASGSGYVGEIYDNTHNPHEATCVPVTPPGSTPDIDFYLAGITLQARPTLEAAVEDGVAWLAGTQNPDGSWGNEFQVPTTALAVLNLEIYARKTLGIPPLDPAYVYSTQVLAGLKFILEHAQVMTLDPGGQLWGDPDGNTNGMAVYFASDGYDVYNTSIGMTAIAASGAPDALVTVPGSQVHEWTYRKVLEDLVEWLAWAQTDLGYGKGGWNYEGMDNTGDRSDQSNSGWASLALAYAEVPPPEGFGISPPGFVRSELDIWINATQNNVDGGSIYDPDPTRPEEFYSNSLRTGNMLQQMAFVGDTDTTGRVRDGLAYLAAHWDEWRGGCPVSYQATYTIMKGFTAFGLKSLDSINWFEDFADALLPEQTVEGRWPISQFDRDNGMLSTNWALLTLQEGAPGPDDWFNLVMTDKHEEWIIPGVTYAVHYTITNKGTLPTPSSVVKLAVDGADAQEAVVPALQPGEATSNVFPVSIAITGACDYVAVCADADESIVELYEHDNCGVNTLCPKPDLVVKEKHEAWIIPWQTYTVHYTLENVGDKTASAGHDVQLTVDDVAVESQEIGVELAPGATYTGEFTKVITLSDDLDYVEVCADAKGDVEESDEGKNCLPNEIHVPPIANLIVNIPDPEWLVYGQSYFVRYVIRNIGNDTAAAGHDASLEVDGAILEWQQVPAALAPGASYSGVFARLVPLSDGRDEVTVCADVNGKVAERNETDNCRTLIIKVPPEPDLRIVDKFETWVVGQEKQRYTVSVTVGNFGNGTAAAGHRVGLSVDGRLVDTEEVGVDLGPGGSCHVLFDSVIEISPECDEITVCADVYEVVDESDEDNNCVTNVWCVETPLIVPADIKPGSCPNPLNRKSKGVLPVALVGTATFDVSQVELSTLQLSRADGEGKSVKALEGPRGPHSVIEDVAAPVEGEACECDESGADGIPDLVMKFDTPKLVMVLELEALDPGTPVELVVTGSLSDGTPFRATDCIMLVPPGDHDLDGDGDVDLTDFAQFQACFNGPNRPSGLPGKYNLANSDGDVGVADFLMFQACFNGPNRPPACE